MKVFPIFFLLFLSLLSCREIEGINPFCQATQRFETVIFADEEFAFSPNLDNLEIKICAQPRHGTIDKNTFIYHPEIAEGLDSFITKMTLIDPPDTTILISTQVIRIFDSKESQCAWSFQATVDTLKGRYRTLESGTTRTFTASHLWGCQGFIHSIAITQMPLLGEAKVLESGNEPSWLYTFPDPMELGMEDTIHVDVCIDTGRDFLCKPLVYILEFVN